MDNPVSTVVVGAYRGALAYVRELLFRAGYAVGDAFDRSTSPENLEAKAANSVGIEVSPYLVPYLAHPQFAQVRVVYVTRDPARVVPSLLRLGYPRAVAEPVPTWFDLACRALVGYRDKFDREGMEVAAAISYVHNWFELAKKLRPDLVHVQIESGPYAILSAITQGMGSRAWRPDARVPYCPLNLNASPYYTAPVLSDALRIELEAAQAKQGYYEAGAMPRGGHAHYTSASWHC